MTLLVIVYPVMWSLCVPFVVDAALAILPALVIYAGFMSYGNSIDEFFKLFSLGFT